jgi:hypothetical protein
MLEAPVRRALFGPSHTSEHLIEVRQRSMSYLRISQRSSGFAKPIVMCEAERLAELSNQRQLSAACLHVLAKQLLREGRTAEITVI